MADSDSPARERRSRRGGWRRGLLRAALLGVLALATLYGLRSRLIGPGIARYLAGRARTELGAELEIARVSGDWIHAVVLEGVRWRSPRGPLRALDEGRVELGFSLRGLLEGAPGWKLGVHGRDVRVTAPEAGGAAPELPEIEEIELALEGLSLARAGGDPLELDAVQVRGALRSGRAEIEALQLEARGARLRLTQASLPLDAGPGLAVLRATRGVLEVELEDGRLATALLGRALPLQSASLSLALEEGAARVSGHAALTGGSLVIEQGALTLAPDAALEDLSLDLSLDAHLDDLLPASSAFGLPLAGSWSGEIDVRGPLRAPSGRFVGHGEGLRFGRLALETLEVDVETDGGRARFARCEASGPDLEAVVRGEVRFDPLELEGVAMNVWAGPEALASLLSFPCEEVFVHARLNGPVDALQGQFEASASGTTLAGFRVDDAEVRGTLQGERVVVEELRAVRGESFAELAGTLERTSAGYAAQLARMTLDWRGARVELARATRVDFGAGRLAVDDLELRSSTADAGGQARITVRHEDGTTRGALAFEHYDAGPLLAPFLPAGLAAGAVDGRIEGVLGGPAPAFEFDLDLAGWTPDNAWPPVDLRARGGFDGHELAFESLALGFEGDERARLAGSLRVPLDPTRPLQPSEGPVEVALELEASDPLHTLARAGLVSPLASSGPSRVALDLHGSWKALRGTLDLEAERITLGSGERARTCDLAARVVLDETVRIERALFRAPSGSITLAGTLGLAPDLTALGSQDTGLLDVPLALEAHVDLADVSWIAGLRDDLRRISGRVQGTVGIGGDAREPSLSGSLTWTEGELRLASSAPPLRALAAEIALEGELVRIVSLTGEVGGAPVRVTGTLEPFGPFPRLDLAVRGENVLLARDAHLLVRADADLVVKGTPTQLAIRGELGLAEGRYRGEISPLEQVLRAGRRAQAPERRDLVLWSNGPLASAELDVHLGGERTFEYDTNLLTASLRPDARLRGTGAYPSLEGPVYVTDASLILPSGKLQLVSGLLTFRPEQPFRPEVALRAEMRVQRHDVRLVATGFLDDPEVELSSTPPLPREDLWILTLTGQLPTERWQDRSTQAMEALALFLARDSLVRWFDADPNDPDGLLERFEIDVGAKTSLTGQPTGRVLFYLRPRSRTSGRATYLSAEFDEFDRVNYAFGIVFRPR